ncbi:MAG: CoA-disulfide reductase [Clostridiales bacterium]|nr:CoA-disulfide reductase [Clostridiales bacterium]
MKAIIIGGVAAGMSAASKLKRTMPDAQVLVYERGSFLSYGACGIPYFVGGVNDNPDLLIARSREAFEKQGIQTFLRHEAIEVDPARRIVQIKDLDSGRVFEDSYDKLMIAVGCDSVVLPIPGADLTGVFYLKSMEDGLLLEKILKLPDVRSAVIVGGGYIGVEMAEALLERKLSVTLIEAADRLLTPFEPAFSQLAAEELAREGVNLRLGEKVSAIEARGNERVVHTSLASYAADLVVMCAGVVPATDFLRSSGISMARNGALLVDRQMRTSLADVYAAGDCAVVYNRITGEDFFLPLGTVANKCGRIAGGNMAGESEAFIGALGTAAIKVCGLEMGRTGMSEQDAKRTGKNYATNTVKAFNHPAYYPGRKELTIQLIWEQGSRLLLGANAAGPYGSGAVLRADMLAIAIHAGMSTEELGMVDLAYAPPFSGVWDAVHIAANAAK